jgi:hypothetical protein
LHNVTLDQCTISVGKSEFVHCGGLMALRFSISKKDLQFPLHFVALPIINWWIINDLQFLGDPSWATDARATMKQTDRWEKGIIGKVDWCLGSRWTSWCVCSYVEASGFVLCVGEGVLVTLHWKSCCELWKSFCNMLHRVILYFLRVITS